MFWEVPIEDCPCPFVLGCAKRELMRLAAVHSRQNRLQYHGM
jgi:hypothetical protein